MTPAPAPASPATSDVPSHGIRRIGVLTGGGDCPGLNAVIRAVTKTAIMQHGMRVFGIEDGFLGLIQNRIRELDTAAVSNILTTGGTILGTSNKANPKRYASGEDENGEPIFKDVTDRCLDHIRHHALDALVVIGGDGTMSVAKHFVEAGINCIGVPKTIDNDLVGTDIPFGFSTAVATATTAIDRIHTTAASHHRAMVVEVMGRNAGWIALYAGVATGADVILIPEIPFDHDVIADYVLYRSRHQKKCSIVCVSEGATPRDGEQVVARVDETSPDPIRLGGIGKVVADRIEAKTGIESRTTVLGHIQRGGTPVHADRLLGTLFGHHAVDLLAGGERNRLVVMKRDRITSMEITGAADKQRYVPADEPLLVAARAVGTCFGDEAPVTG